MNIKIVFILISMVSAVISPIFSTLPVTNNTGQKLTIFLDYPSKPNAYDVLTINNNETFNIEDGIANIIVLILGDTTLTTGLSPDGKTFDKKVKLTTLNIPQVSLNHVLGSDEDYDVFGGNYPELNTNMREGENKGYRIVPIIPGNKSINSFGLWRLNVTPLVAR